METQGWYEEGPYAVTRVVSRETGHSVPDSCLVLKMREGIWRVVWEGEWQSDMPFSAHLERCKRDPLVAHANIDDLALRFMVAIRDKDEGALRDLCVDRIEDWSGASVGGFAREMRERFRQMTGEEFVVYPTETRIEKDLAVVVCRPFQEVQEKLNWRTLLLYFCRTDTGWRIWNVEKIREVRQIEEHLEQARKRAAKWKHAAPAVDKLRAGSTSQVRVGGAERAARTAYAGEWEWREGGGSDDFCLMTLGEDGTAVVMEDGEDGVTGRWSPTEDGIMLTVADDTVAGFLDADGRLVLGKGRGAPRFVRKRAPATDENPAHIDQGE